MHPKNATDAMTSKKDKDRRIFTVILYNYVAVDLRKKAVQSPKIYSFAFVWMRVHTAQKEEVPFCL